MDFIQQKLTDHFNKILLAVLYIGTVAIVVHLMHKSDAGGDDAAFILWATNTASLIIGRLLGMMPSDAPAKSLDTKNKEGEKPNV